MFRSRIRRMRRAVLAAGTAASDSQDRHRVRGIPLDQAEAELREAGAVPTEQAVAWAATSDLPDVDVDLEALDDDLNAADDEQDPAVEGNAG